jgi:lipoprotein-releasing system permease protein
VAAGSNLGFSPGFELFVARRYLRARRKEAVISVITAISVIGVAAGVMALIIALSVNNGFHNTLQRNLLGAMAHVNVQAKDGSDSGMEHWDELVARIRQAPHVTAVSPVLYAPVLMSGPMQQKGAELKGVDVKAELAISDTLRHLKQGSTDRLLEQEDAPIPGIILGSKLAEDTGMLLNSIITVISPQGELTPMGARPSIKRFRVVGIFETGFFEIDDLWAFTTLRSAQRALSLPNLVNRIEINVDNIDRAQEYAQGIERAVGNRYGTTTWIEQNKMLNNALRLERMVTIITIGLIELVAGLNILITLVMMVMEKYRDIGVLMSMGARREQIRRIFMLQGVLIGVVGTAIGLVAGFTLCYFANKYRWVRLPEQVYSLSFVPLESRWWDGLWVGAAAILVSFLATIYPSRNATRVSPVEVIRYE